MYIALVVILAGIGGILVVRALSAGRRPLAGTLFLLASAGFFALLSFWGEMLWFEALGFGDRFWTVTWARLGLALGGAVATWLLVRTLAGPVPPSAATRWWPGLTAVALGAVWGNGVWQRALLYLHAVPGGVTDPVLGKDAGFYLFRLPLYDSLFWLALLGVSLASSVVAVAILSARGRGDETGGGVTAVGRAAIEAAAVRCAAALALVLAWGSFLSRYHLMYSTWGAVSGPGWTDVHIRLPAYGLVAIVTAVVGAGLLVPGLRGRLTARLPARLGRGDRRGAPPWVAGDLGAVAVAAAAVSTVWLLALLAVPGLVQWLLVEPNEITFEAPYIAHNIDFTRKGFGLEPVEGREFPVAPGLSSDVIEANESLLSEVRLWDWRALDAVYKQFQEIRLYYEFVDVDIDRYTVGDDYRQVMVSAREMEPANLPERSQTFVNRRFKYTHGFGITLAPVSEFTPDGLPRLLVKDLPPRSEHPDLEVEQPRIYYGELTTGPVVGNSAEEEFDYPSGDENAYVRYQGSGGVRLSNLWRKFVYGWMFDGTRFLLSSYPTPESRFLFRRQIRERVEAVAPFLEFDEDPYVALVDGRLVWIVDAYTTSEHYPYSEPYTSRETLGIREGDRTRAIVRETAHYLHGVNYLRNSVKAVVDAYDGSVDFYVFEPEDPLVQAWQGVFPGLFRREEEMSEPLRAHVRYPEGYLLAQGIVYARYHMEDPAVFYNQEDLWVRATEKYYGEVQPVEPYYVMWQLPGSERAEFSLILPFTPKNRQVLIGWIAGLSDGDNYGRLLAYKFPKERRVLGPQQVETKIDQDRFLSGQLTLWDQRGSRVIRGNVLAIPIGETLLYVEPIYLQAETAAYPELRLVAVMHGDDLSYAPSFREALAGLMGRGGEPGGPGSVAGGPEAAAAADRGWQELVQAADRAFRDYLRLQGEGRFEEAARELEALQRALEQLSELTGEETRP